MDNLIGKKLDGRYEIQEIIGIGGMAVVYKAYDCIDDRTVAVKVLKDEYLKNDEFRRRFKNESKAVAVLSHPNIVKVYDVSFGDRIQYIVMEYIDGITLKEYIDQQKVLTWKEAVHFTVQILRALSHAHERGIVHRDIKPQNIMMLEDGTIKVTDFGIARFAHSETHTMTDKAIGSVHYISPEQARGSITDEKSDVYSVGVMLYEMLTGALPFEADSAVSVAIMQMQETPQKLRDLNPEVPEGLEEITLRAMRKDPEQRYQSAAEMLDDIERFKHNPSIHFQYQYFVDESPTKYIDAINEVKGKDGEETAAPNDGKLDKNGKKKKKKPDYLPILAGAAGAVVLVAVLIGVFYFIIKGGFSDDSSMTVPNLVGMQLDAAQKQYTDLNIVQETTMYDPTAPKGQIVKQNPAKDTNVKKNSTVKVTVSLGQQSVIVPDVSKKSVDDATQALKDAGFTNISQQTQTNDDLAANYVIGTNPASGETADPTATITLIVSVGPDTGKLVTVPNVVGQTKDQAVRTIQDKKLVADASSEDYSDSVDKGKVISQDQTANTQVAEKTTMKIVISKGKKPAEVTTAEVPSISGKTYKEAVKALKGQGFNIYETDGSNSVTDDSIVLKTNPAAGSVVNKSTTIKIYIAQSSSSSTDTKQ